MENALGTVFSPAKTRKALARVALVDVKESARTVLSECFRQFGIETVVMSDTAADRLKREKFEACVVRLCPETEPILESARTSPSNNRMVIYGMGGTIQDALKYSRYGINAVFNEPIERPSALKLVRATQMLVLHEFRRYVRIPVITEVSVALAEGARFSASSQEISSGGMSLRSGQDISPGQPVEISFALLTLPRIWVRSTVSWRMPGNKTFGVRFDAHDERRLRVKEWIESYLDN
jgi:PilZ domain